MDLNLTNVERLILGNQYRILAKLNEGTHDEEYFQKKVEILDRGYAWYYGDLLVSEPLPIEVSVETMDILDMFRQIDAYVSQLKDNERETLNVEKLTFKGFDANNDPHYGFAKFIIEKDDRYGERKGMYLNSHTNSTLPRYRRMLEVYRAIRGKDFKNLTLDDLKMIQEV